MHEPTIDNPVDSIDSSHFLNAVPEQVWLMNNRNGSVIRKFGETDDGVRSDLRNGVVAVPTKIGQSCVVSPDLRPTDEVAPVNPGGAISARTEGDVRFGVTVGTDGQIEYVQLLGGEPLLVGPAQSAVERYRFAAPNVNGRPICVSTEVTIPFRLRK